MIHYKSATNVVPVTVQFDTRGEEVHTWLFDKDIPPLFIEAASSKVATIDGFVNWVKANRPSLDRLLIQHGGMVFRGFPVKTADDFNAWVALYDQFESGYAGGATLRSKIKGNVFESTRYSADLKIPQHQEMAYVRDYPGRIAFHCHTRAKDGGETPINDMRRLTAELPESLRMKLAERGTLVTRNFAAPPADGSVEFSEHPDERSWKTAFYTDNADEVIQICADKGMEPIWNDNKSLTVRNRLDAFTKHPSTGEVIYRSSIHMWSGRAYMAEDSSPTRAERIHKMYAGQKYRSDVSLGDGSQLSADECKLINQLHDDGEIAWDWQEGDVMLLDNLIMAHGRNSFVGERLTQAALLA